MPESVHVFCKLNHVTIERYFIITYSVYKNITEFLKKKIKTIHNSNPITF